MCYYCTTKDTFPIVTKSLKIGPRKLGTRRSRAQLHEYADFAVKYKTFIALKWNHISN